MSEGDAAKLLSDELAEFCKSNSLSEEGLREIIERFGLTPHDKFNYDFFFWACVNENVTEEIIRCLIGYFPDAPRAVSTTYTERELRFTSHASTKTLQQTSFIS